MKIYANLERGSVSYDVLAIVDVFPVASELDVPIECAGAYAGQFFVDIDRVCIDEPGYPLLSITDTEEEYIKELALEQIN